MDGYSISQVAERTGFTTSALRFYEHHGLVEPDRTPAGYRRYAERHVERLAFVHRAKGFGLRLDEIAELLTLLDDDRCAPVRARLRALLEARIDDAQRRVSELESFTALLQGVASRLGGAPPDGPCDDGCGCTTDPVAPSALPPHPDAPGPEDHGAAAIVCTLAPDAVVGRIDDWQSVLSGVTERAAIDGGLRVRFDGSTDPVTLVELATAERSCCRFFRFAVVLDGAGVALDVTGPPDARPIIDRLFGTAA